MRQYARKNLAKPTPATPSSLIRRRRCSLFPGSETIAPSERFSRNRSLRDTNVIHADIGRNAKHTRHDLTPYCAILYPLYYITRRMPRTGGILNITYMSGRVCACIILWFISRTSRVLLQMAGIPRGVPSRGEGLVPARRRTHTACDSR